MVQESSGWRWTLFSTITPSLQTAARPQATPALHAPPEHHCAVTLPWTEPEIVTGVSAFTHLLNHHRVCDHLTYKRQLVYVVD